MVKHIVMYKLKENSQKAKEELVNVFLSMKGKIPYLKSITSGADFLNSERSYDVVLICEFESAEDMEKYKGVYAITPNQPDSEKQTGFFIKDDETLYKAGEKLLKELDLEKVLLTRGENGMALFEKENGKTVCKKIPAYNKKEVFDVTGAGDTVVAAFALGLCAGLEGEIAMKIGNLAASIVIRYFGCHTVTCEDLKEEIKI